MAVRKQRDNLWNDVRGDAVVEATILFPIIIMVFAGLVLLAMYLPTGQHSSRPPNTPPPPLPRNVPTPGCATIRTP